jgi:hypothetical protein
VFLAILGVGVTFEALWYAARRSHAVTTTRHVR